MLKHRGVALGLALVLAAGTAAWARTPIRPMVDLTQLLAPVALYPDPVLAEILPATTVPEDIVLAAKYLEDGGDLTQIDAQPWNDNAKALARWPEILRMMNRSRDWMDSVGAAFLDQTEDVLKAVQRLRAVAMNSGALQNADQQRVTAEDGIIYVYPAEAAVIHLPQYDADKVFALMASSGGAGMVSFGSELLVGYWLHHEIDWRKQRLYSYDYREFPFGKRNPWYFAGQVTGQVPPGLPEQDTGKWKPYRDKVRPHPDLNAPLPRLQVVAAPAAALRDNGTAASKAESRPLAAPKDLPPPPPMLNPVDPSLELMDEAPEKKPAPPPAKAVKAKAAPVKEKAASGKAAKDKPEGAKAVPAKSDKTKPAAEKGASGKTGKAKADAPTAAKSKAAETKATKKTVAPEPESKKTGDAKKPKSKSKTAVKE